MRREKTPDLLAERFLLGELTVKEKEAVIAELGVEKGGFGRLEELKESNKDILNKYPAEDMADRIKARYEGRERTRQAAASMEKEKSRGVFSVQLRFGLSAVAVILIAVFISIPVMNQFTGGKGGDNANVQNTTRIKGDAKLFVYRKTASGEESLNDGDLARKGDTIQLAYQAGNEKYGMIFSVDGNGSLTLHYPYTLQDQSDLTQGKKIFLKDAYQLDNAPRFERFFFVLSEDRMAVNKMIEKANTLAANQSNALDRARNLFEGKKVIVFTLSKEDVR